MEEKEEDKEKQEVGEVRGRRGKILHKLRFIDILTLKYLES